MKKYKCKNCREETNILTLGDLYQGCANCGSLKGFLENKKGKWVDKNQKNKGTDRINNFLKTDK